MTYKNFSERFVIDPRSFVFTDEKKSDKVQKYGTTEGALRGWDVRGRGRKTPEKPSDKTPKIDTSKADSIKEYAVTRYGEKMFVNTVIKSYSMDMLTAGDFTVNLKGEFVIAINNNLSDDQFWEKAKANIIKSGYENFTVANKYFINDRDKFIKSTVDHEVGHLKISRYNLILSNSHDEFDRPIKDNDEINQHCIRSIKGDPEMLYHFANGDSEWRELCREVTKSGFSISEYSLENFAEKYAELYSAKESGIEIPEKVSKYIDKVDKFLEDFDAATNKRPK